MKNLVCGLGMGLALACPPASVFAYTNIPPGGTLWLQGYDLNPASPSFRNEGTVKLECIDDALGVGLTVLDPGLQNAPTGRILFNPGAGGGRFFTGRLHNQGEIQVNFPTLFHYPETRVENEGRFLTTATAWTEFEGPQVTFVQRSGELKTGHSFEMIDGAFEYEGGTVEGELLLIQSHLRVAESATNALAARFLGPDASFEGTLAADQVLRVSASPDHGAGQLRLAVGSLIQGRISLTSTNTNAPALLVADGSITIDRQGALIVEAGSGGHRQVQGNLALKGLLEVTTECSLDTGGRAFTNQGTLLLRPGLLFPPPIPPSEDPEVAGSPPSRWQLDDFATPPALASTDPACDLPQRRSRRMSIGTESLSTVPLRLCAFLEGPADPTHAPALAFEPDPDPEPPAAQPIVSYPRVTIEADLIQDAAGRMEFVIEPANGSWLAPVRVQGTARLAGSLKLHLSEGSEVTVGRQFPLIAASRIRGGFTRVEFPAARPGQRWSLQVSAGILQAIVTSGPPRLSVYLDRQTDGSAILRVNGAVAEDIVLEQSVNLRNWTPLDGWFEVDGGDVIFGEVPTTVEGKPAFFRARHLR